MKEIKITEIENIRIGSAENKEAGMSVGAARHPGNRSS